MENNYSNKNYIQRTAPNAAVEKKSFTNFMATTGNKLISSTITDPKRKTQFIANLMTAISNNPTLQECEQVSVVAGALQAEALHFPLNNSLGYVYLVPFNDKKAGIKKAQFQIGYKGYIQLAIRSGLYKDINVIEVKEGELGNYDPLNGQTFNWINDYYKRQEAKTIGYVGQLELTNGFKKQIYFTFEAMLDHADKYSQAFSKDTYLQVLNGTYRGDAWKLSSFWYKNFDEMAKKTVLRQLLSKWGIMSVELQEAYIKDQTEMKADGTYDYIDSTNGNDKSKEYQNDTSEQVSNKQQQQTASQEPPIDMEMVDDTMPRESDFDY